jgi:20S proteasome subunit beta 4
LAADMNAARSIMVMESSQDKILELDDNKILAAAGDAGDRDQFCQFVQKNVHLNRLRFGNRMSTHATANWTRAELAKLLRSAPVSTNLLLAGFDFEESDSERKKKETMADDDNNNDNDEGSSSSSSSGSLSGKKGKPSLWFLDYLASALPTNFAAHGYAAYFITSVLDKNYSPGMNEQQVIELVRLCIHELEVRFVMKHPKFLVKIVDRNGVRQQIITSE